MSQCIDLDVKIIAWLKISSNFLETLNYFVDVCYAN